MSVTKFLVALIALIATSQLSAYDNYSNEHAAWGGNGGWWGGGNNGFYDDYAWRNEDSYTCPSCRRSHYRCDHCGDYHPTCLYRYPNRNVQQQNEYEYNETVPGAGLYIHN